jgi:hypothetical protein
MERMNITLLQENVTLKARVEAFEIMAFARQGLDEK